MFTEPLDFIYLRNVYWMPTVCQAPRQAPWGIVASFSWQVPSWRGHFVEEWRQMSTGPGEGFWSKHERVPAFRDVPSLRAPQGFSFRASLPLAGLVGGFPSFTANSSYFCLDLCPVIPTLVLGVARGGFCSAEHQMAMRSLFAVWVSHHSANRLSLIFHLLSFHLNLIS